VQGNLNFKAKKHRQYNLTDKRGKIMYAVKQETSTLVDQPKLEQSQIDERLVQDLEDLIRFRKTQMDQSNLCHTSIQEELSFFEEELRKLLME
jgi:hypothetical protein